MYTHSEKFKKGFVVGSLVGGAMVWMVASKKGKQLRMQALEGASEVYDRVRERIMETETWDKISQSRFAEIVQDVVDKYIIETGLSENVSRIISKIVNRQWGTFKKEAIKKKKLIIEEED